MAELPQMVNKALYVCPREGHVLYTILSLSRTVTVCSLILYEQTSQACSKTHNTLFVKNYHYMNITLLFNLCSFLSI